MEKDSELLLHQKLKLTHEEQKYLIRKLTVMLIGDILFLLVFLLLACNLTEMSLDEGNQYKLAYDIAHYSFMVISILIKFYFPVAIACVIHLIINGSIGAVKRARCISSSFYLRVAGAAFTFMVFPSGLMELDQRSTVFIVGCVIFFIELLYSFFAVTVFDIYNPLYRMLMTDEEREEEERNRSQLAELIRQNLKSIGID